MKVLGGLRRPPQLDVDFFDIKLSNPPLVNSNIKSFEKKQKKNEAGLFSQPRIFLRPVSLYFIDESEPSLVII